jgi:SAM-dependent methyltransferase
MFEPLYDLLMSDVDYEALLKDIEPYLKKHDFILDAGCGSGHFLVELLKKGYHAIGIDYSSSMLSLADERLRGLGLATKLYEHDLRKPMHAEVDVIVAMFDVMNYFKGIKSVFKHCYQALYPGGRLIFDLYQETCLETYDGYLEEEVEPVSYRWQIERRHKKMIHTVDHQGERDIIIQYVYPLSYYQEALASLGFDVKVNPSIDARKHLVIATKK